MSVVVEHSADHPSDRSEMDEEMLEPFEYVVHTTGYLCKCHGWEVQKSVHVQLIKTATLVVGEIGELG